MTDELKKAVEVFEGITEQRQGLCEKIEDRYQKLNGKENGRRSFFGRNKRSNSDPSNGSNRRT